MLVAAYLLHAVNVLSKIVWLVKEGIHISVETQRKISMQVLVCSLIVRISTVCFNFNKFRIIIKTRYEEKE